MNTEHVYLEKNQENKEVPNLFLMIFNCYTLMGWSWKPPRLLNMTKLMQFVPPIYQQYYQDVIRNHKKIVETYKNSRKKKNKKNKEPEQEPQLQSDGKAKNYFNFVYSPTKIYFGQKSHGFVPLVVIMFTNCNFARIL